MKYIVITILGISVIIIGCAELSIEKQIRDIHEVISAQTAILSALASPTKGN